MELKRPSVIIRDILEIEAQIAKYKTAMEEYAEKEKREKNYLAPHPVDVVCVLGQEPRTWARPLAREQEIKSLEAKRIRVMTYGALISNARRMYQEYLDSVPKSDAEILNAVKNIMAAGTNQGK